jgi:hypothetical protein
VTDLEHVAPAQVIDAATLEQVVVDGDLANLSAEQRLAYYNAVCQSLGVNPLTKPFEYIKLSGKLTLYARKDAADQLRRRDHVSTRISARDMHEQIGIYIVTAQASLPDGRSEESTGVVSIAGLKGENLANALMKAETKAKRRATLSICGLGWLDETEVESISGPGDTISSPSPASGPEPRSLTPGGATIPEYAREDEISAEQRSYLLAVVDNLDEQTRAEVAEQAKNLGIPNIKGPRATVAHGELLSRLIDEAVARHPSSRPADPDTGEVG